MRKIKWLIPFLFLFFFTGCYNYRELNQIALTSAIGIDQSENGEYIVTIQVLNTQKQGSEGSSSGEQPKFILYEQRGKTLQSALRTIVFQAPRRLHVNHMDILLISEKVAKEGMKDILDFFARNVEFRKQFLVVISQESDPKEVLQILTPLETFNSKDIKESILANVKYYGTARKVSFEDLLNIYLNERLQIVLPSLKVIGKADKGSSEDNIKQSTPDASVQLQPLAVFKDDKLLGYLTDQQSRTFNYVQNNIQNSIVTFNCSDEKEFTSEITSSKTSLKTNAKEKKIYISIKAKGSIKEFHCDMDLLDPAVIHNLQTMLNEQMEKIISKSIEEVQDTYQADIFGFEDVLYKNSPTAYKKLKEQYGDELIKNLKIEVSVDVKLQTKGNIVREITR